MQEEPDEAAEAEAAQTALRESMERARELLSEAKFVIGHKDPAPSDEQEARPRLERD